MKTHNRSHKGNNKKLQNNRQRQLPTTTTTQRRKIATTPTAAVLFKTPTSTPPTPPQHALQTSPHDIQTRTMAMTKTKQPLSYRHLYHAGNHADVMKHAIFIQLAAQQLRKIPFGHLFIDTHAGPGGTYDLQHEYARKTNEFMHGVGRIYDLARISALNPHITSETTLRRGIEQYDPGYTHDPLYLRLQAPASDLFEQLPLQHGVTAPGGQTGSLQYNQNRGELIVPVMTTPHPLVQSANHASIVNPVFEDKLKNSYFNKAGIDKDHRRKQNVVTKLNRYINKITTKLHSIEGQQELIVQLKKEFALLQMQTFMQQKQQQQLYDKMIAEGLDPHAVDDTVDDGAEESGEMNTEEEAAELARIEKNRVVLTEDGEDEEFDVNEFVAEEGIELSEDMASESSEGGSNASSSGSSGSDDDHVITFKHHTQDEFVLKRQDAEQQQDKKAAPHHKQRKKHHDGQEQEMESEHFSEDLEDTEDAEAPAPAADIPLNDQDVLEVTEETDVDEDINDTLIGAQLDKFEKGPMPAVGEAKKHLYTNSFGERTTFRRLGKPEVKRDEKTGELKLIDPLKAALIQNKTADQHKTPGVHKNKGVEHDDPEHYHRVSSGGLQEDPITARKRAINVLTKRLTVEHDPIEDVVHTMQYINQSFYIPTRDNNLIKTHSNKEQYKKQYKQQQLQAQHANVGQNEDDDNEAKAKLMEEDHDANQQLNIIRTNQLDTTHVFSYFRHLLPIPHSMLPYLSLLTAANKPPTLNSIIQRANYTDLLVGDAITQEKAQALEERQKREVLFEGTFTQSVRLSKDEKLKLLKSVVNGSVVDAYLHDIDNTYHQQQKMILKAFQQDDDKVIQAARDSYDEMKAERLEKERFGFQYKNNNNRNNNRNNNNYRNNRNNNNNNQQDQEEIDESTLEHLNIDPETLFMQQHKPHMSLYNPLTHRQYIPQTMHKSEWLSSTSLAQTVSTTQLSSTTGILEDEDKVYPLLNRPSAKDVLFAPNPTSKRDYQRRVETRQKGHVLKPHQMRGDNYDNRRDNNNNNNNFERRRERDEFRYDGGVDDLDYLPEEHRKGGAGQFRGRFAKYNNNDQSARGSRDSRDSRDQSRRNNDNRGGRGNDRGDRGNDRGGYKDNMRQLKEKHTPAFKPYVNTGGLNNISFGQSSVYDDIKEKERQKRDIERRADDNNNDDNAPRREYNNNNNHNNDRRPQQQQRGNNNRDTSKMSLKDLKRQALSGNLKREFSTNNGDNTPKRFAVHTKRNASSLLTSHRNLQSSSSTSMVGLPPTLQALAPMARLGVINPDIITNILKAHFSTETQASDVWSQMMMKNKEKSHKTHEHKTAKKEHGNNNNRNNNNNYKNNNNNGGYKKSRFNNNNGEEAPPMINLAELGIHDDDDRPRGDSRRSRDNHRRQENRREVWERVVPSTEIIGIDNDFDPYYGTSPTDKAKHHVPDSLEDINNTFVSYPQDIPIISKAPIKSLYLTTDTPIQTLNDKYDVYFKTTKKLTGKKKKQQQQQQQEQETNAEKNYQDEHDEAAAALYRDETDLSGKFKALTTLQGEYDISAKALGYLQRNLALYMNPEQLFHTPLHQPLYATPSSPWIMNNLIRNNFYDAELKNNKKLVGEELTPDDVVEALQQYDKDLEVHNINNPDKHNYLPMIKDILVLNELHSTEYQNLKKNNTDTIMNEFYHEAIDKQKQELVEAHGDVQTKTQQEIKQEKEHKAMERAYEEQHKAQQREQDVLEIQQMENDANGNGNQRNRQAKAPKVPLQSKTLGDAISRIAATVAVETTQKHNHALQLFGQKYSNFNQLQSPLTAETHGAHNIFIDPSHRDADGEVMEGQQHIQRFAFQYDGFQTAQMFFKQFQYYADFIKRMSYSAVNPASPGVQYLNGVHDQQFADYEMLHNQKYNGAQSNALKKEKHTNFISTSLTLCDPAYETGEEYVKALDLLRTTLDFNSRGNAHTLSIWYPVLDKIDPNLPDDFDNKPKQSFDDNGFDGSEDGDDISNSQNKNKNTGISFEEQQPFDMSKVTRRDINRGHFYTTLQKQFDITPKHQHHSLFLSVSSYLVNQYRSTVKQPYQTGKPYAFQAPTGFLDTCVAETYVGVPANLPPQRKNIYMTGSGMLITSPLLPQELDQSLTTMLPWISTALSHNSLSNVYDHVTFNKNKQNKKAQSEDNGTTTDAELAPLADYTLTWM